MFLSLCRFNLTPIYNKNIHYRIDVKNSVNKYESIEPKYQDLPSKNVAKELYSIKIKTIFF